MKYSDRLKQQILRGFASIPPLTNENTLIFTIALHSYYWFDDANHFERFGGVAEIQNEGRPQKKAVTQKERKERKGVEKWSRAMNTYLQAYLTFISQEIRFKVPYYPA